MKVDYNNFNTHGERERGHKIQIVSRMTGMTPEEIMGEVDAGRLEICDGDSKYKIISRNSLVIWFRENDLFRTDLNEIPDNERLTTNDLTRLSGLSRGQLETLINRGVIPVLSKRFKYGKHWFIAGDLKKSQFIEYFPETPRSQKQAVLLEFVNNASGTQKQAEHKIVKQPDTVKCVMQSADVISDIIGLYILKEPMVIGDGPFEGRILGKEEGFYVVQQFYRTSGAHDTGIRQGGISFFRPVDLYGDKVTLFRTPEELELAVSNYWGRARNRILVAKATALDVKG